MPFVSYGNILGLMDMKDKDKIQQTIKMICEEIDTAPEVNGYLNVSDSCIEKLMDLTESEKIETILMFAVILKKLNFLGELKK